MKTQIYNVILLCLLASTPSLATFKIESLDSNGQLSFIETTNATSYWIEWASSPTGTWTRTWINLSNIPADGTGTVTRSVPMFYRVVAIPIPQGMVKVPGGTNSGTDSDFGEYSLSVDTFYMDETEIAKAEWDEVYQWAITNGYNLGTAGSGKHTNHPIHSVSGSRSAMWCNAKSEMKGRAPCYTDLTGDVFRGFFSPAYFVCDFEADGFRLPTVTEWEYAARGGLIAKRFPTGDSIAHDDANYQSVKNWGYDVSLTDGYHPTFDVDPYPYTSPVGSFAPNGYGLYDMAGNVAEWCWNLPGEEWEYRGGSWEGTAYHARCGNIDGGSGGGTTIGFRTVCR